MGSLGTLLILAAPVCVALYVGVCIGAAMARSGGLGRAEEWLDRKRRYARAIRGEKVHPLSARQHELQLQRVNDDLIRAAGGVDAAWYEATEFSFFFPWRERVLLAEWLYDARRRLGKAVRRG